MTEREQRLLLKVTGEHRAGFRDRVLYAMALGTGLREQCDQKGKLATVCVGGTCRDAPGTGQAGAECWSDKQCSGVGASCVGVAACDCGAVCIQDSPGKCVLPK